MRLAHPVEKRMLSLEDAADLSGKGSKFKIVTEITAPSSAAMKAAMGHTAYESKERPFILGPSFLHDFRDQAMSRTS